MHDSDCMMCSPACDGDSASGSAAAGVAEVGQRGKAVGASNQIKNKVQRSSATWFSEPAERKPARRWGAQQAPPVSRHRPRFVSAPTSIRLCLHARSSQASYACLVRC